MAVGSFWSRATRARGFRIGCEARALAVVGQGFRSRQACHPCEGAPDIACKAIRLVARNRHLLLEMREREKHRHRHDEEHAEKQHQNEANRQQRKKARQRQHEGRGGEEQEARMRAGRHQSYGHANRETSDHGGEGNRRERGPREVVNHGAGETIIPRSRALARKLHRSSETKIVVLADAVARPNSGRPDRKPQRVQSVKPAHIARSRARRIKPPMLLLPVSLASSPALSGHGAFWFMGVISRSKAPIKRGRGFGSNPPRRVGGRFPLEFVRRDVAGIFRQRGFTRDSRSPRIAHPDPASRCASLTERAKP